MKTFTKQKFFVIIISTQWQEANTFGGLQIDYYKRFTTHFISIVVVKQKSV